MPFQQKELERLGASFRLTKKLMKINDGMITSSEIPLIKDYEKVS